MALIADKNVKTFDMMAIKRGDLVSVRRVNEPAFRNGFVTKANEDCIEILYSNVQNNATSYGQVMAVDVAIGLWEVYWSADLKIVNYENNGPGGGSAAPTTTRA